MNLPGIETNGRGGRLYHRVAEQLAEVISAGEYPEGSRLPAERKLAERFNVSRPTIREAIIALELAGRVEVKGGSGVYVTSGNSGSFKSTDRDVGPFEILEARILFEGEAAGLAAAQISDEELDDLRQALDDMVRENEKQSDPSMKEAADERFHLIIAKATHNEAVLSVCEHLWQLRNSSSISTRILEKVREAGARPQISEHRAILEALEQRDPQRATAAMRDHLTRVITQMLDATEAEAVEEARRKVKRDRERFVQPR
jgi:DNA-binding FadR family transcriptional regulator